MTINPLIGILLMFFVIYVILLINDVDVTELFTVDGFDKQYTKDPSVFYVILGMLLYACYNVANRFLCAMRHFEKFQSVTDALASTLTDGNKTYTFATKIGNNDFKLVLLDPSLSGFSNFFAKCTYAGKLAYFPALVKMNDADKYPNSFKIITFNTNPVTYGILGQVGDQPSHILTMLQQTLDANFTKNSCRYLCTIPDTPEMPDLKQNKIMIEQTDNAQSVLSVMLGNAKYYVGYTMNCNSLPNDGPFQLYMVNNADEALKFNIY